MHVGALQVKYWVMSCGDDILNWFSERQPVPYDITSNFSTKAKQRGRMKGDDVKRKRDGKRAFLPRFFF